WRWKNELNVSDLVFSKCWTQKDHRLSPEAFKWANIQRRMAETADITITVTNQARQLFTETLGLDPAKIKTIYNGISPPSFRHDKNNVRSLYKLAKSDIVLMFSGRIVESKGIRYLLESFRIVADRLKHV